MSYAIESSTSYLQSMLTPDCPTKVNRNVKDWWQYNKGHGWINDKGHNLHVECYQPGLINATARPAMSDSENMVDSIDSNSFQIFDNITDVKVMRVDFEN